jgi:DNA ligase-1
MATEYNPLYKRTATGAVQLWWGEVSEEDGAYRTFTGQEFGAITSSAWTHCTPKNVGRANATTKTQQAHLELEALYTKKLNQGGYTADKAEIDTPTYFKPMLAKKYGEMAFEFPIFSQPKLDGIRCIATVDGLWSRTGKPILSCPHIMEELKPLFDQDDTLIFDGELYADKFKDDFNAIISLARKTKPTAVDLEASREAIEYHVYDLPSVDKGFDARWDALLELVHKLGEYRSFIVNVHTLAISSQGALDIQYGLYTEQGYEGQILRPINGKYENKRSKNLIKRKEFIDEEFTIVSIEEGKGNRAGMAGYVVYELGDGRQFQSGVKGSWDFARNLLANKDRYAGGKGTVRYFQRTPAGIPRFPVTVAVFENDRDL